VQTAGFAPFFAFINVILNAVKDQKCHPERQRRIWKRFFGKPQNDGGGQASEWQCTIMSCWVKRSIWKKILHFVQN